MTQGNGTNKSNGNGTSKKTRTDRAINMCENFRQAARAADLWFRAFAWRGVAIDDVKLEVFRLGAIDITIRWKQIDFGEASDREESITMYRTESYPDGLPDDAKIGRYSTPMDSDIQSLIDIATEMLYTGDANAIYTETTKDGAYRLRV